MKQHLERARAWLDARPPITWLVTGWVVFVISAYPGYLNFDSTMRLYAVRSGEYTDDAPLMTWVWRLLEWVMAGPAPMLLLQSGLFLFGLAAVLREVLSPRAAAIAAACVLMFPPVFSPMSVIWPEPLMAGALLAGTAALLASTRAESPRRRWTLRAVAALLGVLACGCKPEIIFALAPLVFLGIPALPRWQRGGLAVATVIVIAGIARLASIGLVVTDTHRWEQNLELVDVIGTLRRANVHDDAKLAAALDGITLTDRAGLPAWMAAGHDALDPWALSHGPKRVVEPIASDAQADAVDRAWHDVIGAHRGAYLVHRYAMLRALLGLRGKVNPVYAGFGEPSLLGPLHHRATPSDWQFLWQWFVRLLAKTPLFRAWLYLLLAIAAIVMSRRTPVIRNLAISGLVFELAMGFFAPSADYRYSHWLVATATVAIIGTIGIRRGAAPRPPA